MNEKLFVRIHCNLSPFSTNVLILTFISSIILAWVDISSIFSYLYSLILFFILNKLLCKGERINVWYFHYYLLVSIFLFVLHRYLIPDYLGMTGPEGGIGTDDCRYYAQLKDGQVDYPITFPLQEIFPFTYFLKIIYPFSIDTPLNIVIPNLIGVVFLPYYVNAFSNILLRSKNVGNYAEKLILFCPFTTYYGCIIMRDMWIVTLIIGGFYYFYNKKYVLFVIFCILICFIRFGSVVFIGTGCIILVREKFYSKFQSRMKGRFLFVVMLLFVGVLFSYLFPFLQELSGGKLEDGLFRESFYAILSDMDSDALILRLIELPLPINFIALAIFFFFLPFFSISFCTFGVLNMNTVFCVFLTSIFFFFLWNSILRTILQSLKLSCHTTIKTVVYMAIVFAFCLGTVSLQARHKTALMPILCILAAYGICSTNTKFNWLSAMLTVMLIAVELYVALV